MCTPMLRHFLYQCQYSGNNQTWLSTLKGVPRYCHRDRPYSVLCQLIKNRSPINILRSYQATPKENVNVLVPKSKIRYGRLLLIDRQTGFLSYSTHERIVAPYFTAIIDHALKSIGRFGSSDPYKQGPPKSDRPENKPGHDGDGKETPKNGNDDDESNRKRFIFAVIVNIAVLLIGNILISTATRDQRVNSQGEKVSSEITWNEFVNEYLRKGEVERVVVLKNDTNETPFVNVIVHEGAIVKGVPTYGHNRALKLHVNDPKQFEEKVRAVERELGIPVENTLPIIYMEMRNVAALIRLALAVVVIGLTWALFAAIKKDVSKLMRNPFELMTKASYTRGDLAASHSAPKIRFTDIAGMHQAKVEVREYVEYLKNPTRFQKLGAQIPRGALLLGPPGCGKTLLAKAVAAESDVPFLVMAGSDFVEMLGGLGAARVRQLFKDARSLRPCIIYIDEIDALGRSRGGADATFTSSESEHTLNQLLVEMDGMTNNDGIILLASTNRADVLDKALLRPGRFDRHIMIDLPTLSERKELFELYIKKLQVTKSPSAFSSFLSQATPGMSGADIANVCNEAALYAARTGSKTVEAGDFSYALDRILAGQMKMSTTLSPNERRILAFHECGHVLVGWLLEHTDALLKVSIIPRTGATLGFSQYMPDDKKLYSKEQLFEMMCVALGGRAAETVVFNRITTGAANDLEKVNKVAYSQIRSYGMSDSIGLMSFPAEGDEFTLKPYSKHLQSLMDAEAQGMVAQAYKTAETLLVHNRSKLDKLAELLLKNEVLTYDDVVTAIGSPPHGHKKSLEILSPPTNIDPPTISPSVSITSY